jgi:hypothetical protein
MTWRCNYVGPSPAIVEYQGFRDAKNAVSSFKDGETANSDGFSLELAWLELNARLSSEAFLQKN